ncbi:GntR family transcriptional regulator [Kaistia dalseonensis]|uniref:GntR family transcriptional regulator n=1 Tax=Kaistia dalseonensis TaxID=410840 RepID=A0ABU0HBY5_9HYPH|nr:GntR family transcriptional regulator [Kaistia dalseonensis]MCX5497188.1 GntR family transcriptional regulator [Kaistia dalseonensis]MDQ0439819.1 GntR family transcriptional regulator [Kaistia dalseonensis]
MNELVLAPERLAGEEGGPLYMRLQTMIRGAIMEGRLVPNDALPAEREMAASLHVSRVTVRKAIQGLVAEGVLRQRHGSGTFVSSGVGRVEQPLSRLTSFTEDMRSRGLIPTASWLERSIGMPTSAEAMILGLSPAERVARFNRLRLADNEPMAIERAVVPARILPDPLVVENSLYDALAAVGMRPVRAVQRLNAENVGGADAAMLGLAPGSAALSIERISYLPDGRVVEFTRSHYRGDAYDFVAELNLS